MAKPKIIIADTDFSYISKIQNKFINDFFGEIELLIITEEEWYRRYFDEPQAAEILIVDESLFDQAVLRHSITKVFVLVEDKENIEYHDDKVDYILKYRSIKEIFNKILSKSNITLGKNIEVEKTSKIVVVTSAEGGAGKTTIATGICISFAKNYKRTLYINASNLQTFQFNLNNREPIPNIQIGNLQLADEKEMYEIVKPLIREEIFSYIPPFSSALLSLGLTDKVYKRLAMSAKMAGVYDYIVIDTESSFNESLAELLDIADKVMIVLEQNSHSAFAMNTLVNNINDINSDKYIFVCNKFNKEKENALIRADSEVKINIGDYIEYVENQNSLKPEELENNNLIQKTAYLLL